MGEAQRLEALRSLSVLDTEPEKGFDDLTRAAALAMDTRIALVSLVDAERQWFKASCGLDIKETARDISFCTHAIEEAEPFFVLNAARDERFKDNPLVLGEPFVRFYAGAQLTLPTGETVGTLCVIDDEPRFRITEREIELMKAFADLVVERLITRKASLVEDSAA
ncbi:GAF domain-containing protein [Maricaulaceae bacterium EIL42A08]|nr:GAF domain-containing protein [Maricaulaceae bacterium EIL42A08]